ncbi:MAG: thymidylate kinase [Clostridia bacterium]|nr:thymidylate kinase [Clostridia bacterium]
MGKLIVLDGLDGSGKSTQLDAVDAWLTSCGIAHRRISFPDYDQPSSTLVRQYLAGDFGGTPNAVNAYAASSFYAVDRYASFKQFWQAAYENGELIVAARYVSSNAIHQMAKLPESEWDSYLDWLSDYEYRLLGLPVPDCVFFLDMPPEVSQKLMTGRYEGDESKKDIHERDRVYLQTCRRSALYAAAHDGWYVVSCAKGDDPRPIADITAELTAAIEALL